MSGRKGCGNGVTRPRIQGEKYPFTMGSNKISEKKRWSYLIWHRMLRPYSLMIQDTQTMAFRHSYWSPLKSFSGFLLLIQILHFSLVYCLYWLFAAVDLQISHRKEMRNKPHWRLYEIRPTASSYLVLEKYTINYRNLNTRSLR